MPNLTIPDRPYLVDVEQLFQDLATDSRKGLSAEEAHARLEEFGSNALQETKRESALTILLRQFTGVIVYILVVAAGISFFLGDTVEGVAILAVLLINAVTGFVLEWNARQSMDALRKLDSTPARVLRDGRVREIASEDVTPGDILVVEAGDLVAADANLFQVNQLQVDESALTGESLPVEKQTAIPAEDAPLGDQLNRLFKGTAVTAGNGRAIVTGIGQQTELGKIATMVEEAKRSATPLEEKLDALANVLIWVTVGLATLFLTVGLIRGEEPLRLIETALALAIAAIPEGMSVVATIALAYGMLRLATKKVIVKRLSAVETLGGTNVIFTDKTGTLTQNRIEVNTIQLPDLSAEVQADAGAQTLQIITGNHEIVESDVFQKLVLISVLCNNADYDVVDGKAREVGDPVEVSLLKFAMAAGQNPDEINRDYPRRAEKAFSSDTRIMGTLHEHESRYVIAVKGAAEEILNRSTSIDENTRKKQYELSEKMAADGLRTLAFAYRETDKTTVPGDDFADNDLAYLGLIGFLDPPRTEVTPSLESCRRAGIKVIMVTGDHPATALAIASKVKLIEPGEEIVLTGKDLKPIDQLTADETEKLLNCRVFARVSPAQKLDMIELYQQKGHIVGMTGDGVNDAPALKKSDIGIAMGLRGTQVAAETADMVLKDDSFSSIVAAIAQGRVIFENIRKFVLFLLSCNLSEIFVVTFAGFLNVGTPLLPLQILFINIVTDVFPALALGVGRENASLMERPPRDPKTPIMDTRDWRTLVLYALAMTAAVLGTYGIGTRLLGLNPDEGNNLTFYALSFAQLMHVFNLHSERSFFVNEITRNRYIWYALIVCLAILAFTYFVPVLHDILNIQPMTTTEFSLILASGIAPVVLIQLVRLIVRAMK
ncbi:MULTISPECIES: cation-transporting P-type ATPase [unclassified Spirosoma]|uniref:cation-translocating P-type ATPase n=1 Tax=unclassified Spirosoma TaxID=2621999 RepID=UPI000969E13B|nr:MULTISPECIES: cation-transporting P-type ATPase [unclassified Spirosoma]MBN8826092.1 cation-transporting P-type ATPase [Spirosoma sp.]OJW74579.1 MAG: ATPase [Spirosoma sp. 48-14]